MANQRPLIHSFNAGEVSKAALNRVDLERTRLNCEIQENLFPYSIGKAIIRPGSQYLGQTLNLGSRLVGFSKTLSAKAVLELAFNTSDQGRLRVWFGDELVTREDVSSSITNGTFDASTGWTSEVTGDATAAFTGSLLLAAPNRGGKARAYQQVTTASPGQRHALRIKIARGPVRFKCGDAAGEENYINETALDVGVHSLAFTPLGDYFVEFFTKGQIACEVTSIAVEDAGVMEVDAPWTSAELRQIRTDRSLDVVFMSRDGRRQQKIERRANDSWSVVDYRSDDGPFTLTRTADIRLTPTATYGNTTLAASEPFFKGGHVGALFRLTHEAVVQTCGLGALDEATDPIRVIGIKASTHNDRKFTVTVEGSFVGTLKVQRSFDSEISGFKDYEPANATFTAPGSVLFDGDDDDNAVVWYRVKMTAYSSGSAQVTIDYAGDSGSGICRVVSVINSTNANVEVLTDFRNTASTKDWLEGEWSEKRGYPTAVAFFDGRLWWARDDRFWGSVSNDYYGYSLDVEGDSGSVQRDISTGGDLAEVHWLLPLQRLLFGTAGEDVSARSSSFDEPLTPTNITLKPASTRGAGDISPLKIDTRGIFVGRSGKQIYELFYDLDSSDYKASSITRQHEDLALSAAPEEYGDGVVELGLQREPETYIWGIREDGQCTCMIYVPEEKVAGWFRLLTGRIGSCATNGDRVISMCTLPSTDEDLIYLVVERNIIVSGERQKIYCLEKLRRHVDISTRYSGSEVQNGLYLMDSFITATADGEVGQTITGLEHLAGNAVMAVGQKLGQTYNSPSSMMHIVNDAGEVTLTEAFETDTTIIIGRPYEGRYLSSKIAYGGENGTAIAATKRVTGVSLELLQSHYDALRLGRNLTPVFDERLVDRGASFGGSAYLLRENGFTGAADSKLVSFSFWLRLRGSGTRFILDDNSSDVNPGGDGLNLNIEGDNTLEFSMRNNTAVYALRARSLPLPREELIHVCGAFDMADQSKAILMVNGEDALNLVDHVDVALDFTQTLWTLGAGFNGTAQMDGDIADFWFAPGQYVDFSDAATFALFADFDTDPDYPAPVDLGSDGSAPTGDAPLIFMSGEISQWHVNKGTGGGLTKSGGLSEPLRLPVEDPEMDELPRIKEDGSQVDPDAPFDLAIDQAKYPFPGEWGSDPRVALKVRPGYSAILSAIVVDVETNP
jgi:hypothetical protein